MPARRTRPESTSARSGAGASAAAPGPPDPLRAEGAGALSRSEAPSARCPFAVPAAKRVPRLDARSTHFPGRAAAVAEPWVQAASVPSAEAGPPAALAAARLRCHQSPRSAEGTAPSRQAPLLGRHRAQMALRGLGGRLAVRLVTPLVKGRSAGLRLPHPPERRSPAMDRGACKASAAGDITTAQGRRCHLLVQEEHHEGRPAVIDGACQEGKPAVLRDSANAIIARQAALGTHGIGCTRGPGHRDDALGVDGRR